MICKLKNVLVSHCKIDRLNTVDYISVSIAMFNLGIKAPYAVKFSFVLR